MSKYIVTVKFCGFLLPKKNYNIKTLVFLPRWRGKKTTTLSSIFDCVLCIKNNPHSSTSIEP